LKVSIITTCYNSESTILGTIKSVENQTYKNIEHIIIDGNSSDKTIDIINNNLNSKMKVISEPDDGCYDAFNKGINKSTGEIIGFLHSDDVFYSDTVIEEMCKKIGDAPGIYGDLIYVAEKDINKKIRYWKSKKFNKSNFYFGWMPAHPTLYLRKEIYDKYGDYKTNIGTGADYEFTVRVLFKNNIKCEYLPKIITKMRVGGLSSNNFKDRLIAHFYDWRAWTDNKISVFPFWVILKPLSKIKQYL
tara:strand:- start:13137 stop:13874 length:738 start_codon:yes stop_codon:yes gene_type:complete